MYFEEKVRKKIAESPFGSHAREVFKVLLGEIQQKSACGQINDDQCLSLVKKTINSNNETLGYLKDGDPRRDKYTEENSILQTLMPSFLDFDQILAEITDAGVFEQIKSAKSDGQATGIAMKYLNSKCLPIEGDKVKKVVSTIRS